MPVVDVEQEAQLARRELVLGAEVALIAGLGAEMPEGEGDRSVVGGPELPDRDLRPHR
jgi:hypothetical protein